MKRIVMAVSLLALGACGSDPEGGDSAAAGPTVSTAGNRAQQEESVAAVLHGSDKSPFSVRFLLDSAPRVGVRATVRVDISAAEPVPALLFAASAEGLELDPAASQATLVLGEGGKPVSHAVHFTAQKAGLVEVMIQLKVASGENAATTYSLPVLVSEAAGAADAPAVSAPAAAPPPTAAS
jgi:hypothetical protein